MKVWFFIAGLIEKSDSIAYDLLCQKKILEKNIEGLESLIIARDIDIKNYGDVAISWNNYLEMKIRPQEGDVVIYHYCDGWSEFEDHASHFNNNIIKVFRWHNNTPPWFFLEKINWIKNTIRGFECVVKAANSGQWIFATNSQFTSNQLKNICKIQNHSVVVYPISNHIFKEYSNNNYILNWTENKSLELLFVGRVVPHKSHMLILEFARFLKDERNIDCVVNFAGRCGSLSYSEKLQQFAINNNIKLKLHGEISDSDLKILYEKSELFVCFSQHEGFGLPVYEAMRYGKPIICLLTSAFKEILIGHPLCFENYDPEVIADQIIKLKNDELFLQKVLQFQSAILDHYSEETVTSQLLSLFENIKPNAMKSKAVELEGVYERSFDENKQYFTSDDNVVFKKLIDLNDAIDNKKLSIRVGRKLYIEDSLLITTNDFVNDNGRLSAWNCLDEWETLFYGPYIDLPVGYYALEIDFNFTTDAEKPESKKFLFDVVSKGVVIKEKILESFPDTKSYLIILFQISHESSQSVEFRLRSLSKVDNKLTLLIRSASIKMLSRL